MKRSRLVLVEISSKNDKSGYLNPILGKLGVTRDLCWWLAGKPMVNLLFLLTELFAIYYGSGVMKRNVYSSAVFTGGRSLCTQILSGQGRPPSTILGVRKLETLGYPTVKTASLCVPSFWHNIRVWRTDRQTDGRICRSIYIIQRSVWNWWRSKTVEVTLIPIF